MEQISQKIVQVWFSKERIYIKTDKDNVYSRSLMAFPTLKHATEQQRLAYEIGRWGDDLRWKEIDEDIHISSFFVDKEPEIDNEIARMFKECPELNISEVAKHLNIHKSLLYKYIYGTKKPSAERIAEIKSVLRKVGERLLLAVS